jgi:hypothetical protein
LRDKGLLNDVPLEKIRSFETDFLERTWKAQCRKVLEALKKVHGMRKWRLTWDRLPLR